MSSSHHADLIAERFDGMTGLARWVDPATRRADIPFYHSAGRRAVVAARHPVSSLSRWPVAE